MSKLGDSKVFGLNLKNRIYLASAFIILRALPGLWQFFKALTVLLGYGKFFKNLGLFFQDSASSARVWQALQELVKFFQDSASSSRNRPALPGFCQLLPFCLFIQGSDCSPEFCKLFDGSSNLLWFWQLFHVSASSSRTWPAIPGLGQLFKNLATSPRIRPALQEPGQLSQD